MASEERKASLRASVDMILEYFSGPLDAARQAQFRDALAYMGESLNLMAESAEDHHVDGAIGLLDGTDALPPDALPPHRPALALAWSRP